MTLPDERFRSLLAAEAVLRHVAAPGVPLKKRELRARVRAALRHYPSSFELKEIARQAPNWLKVPR